jgi:hypothetical protein
MIMQKVKIRTSANVNLWPELWKREWHFIPAKFGPIIFGPFEYSAQTSKIIYSAQRSTTIQLCK